MYTGSTELYDAIYRDLKDYGEEARKIDALLRRLQPKPRTLLDVGFGTGEHALRLSRDFGYRVSGIDIQAGFTQIAREKLPDADFFTADMRDFDLGRSFDAILCLFSSIGYVETLEGLGSAFAAFARHLRPGGWLLLEPWVTPENWHPGNVDTVESHDPLAGITVERTRSGSTDGSVSVIDIDYRVETSAGVRHFSETHRLGLFTQNQMDTALENAGFSVKWLPANPNSQTIDLAQLKKPA